MSPRLSRLVLLSTMCAGQACSGFVEPAPDTVSPTGAGGAVVGPGGPRTPTGTGTGGAGPQGPANGGGPGTAFDASKCRPTPQRLWRLTPDQLERTASAVFGGPVGLDVRTRPLAPGGRGYSSRSDDIVESTGSIEAMFEAGRELSARVAKDPKVLHPCLATASDTACLRMAVESFGRRLYRAPLITAVRDELVAYVEKQATHMSRPEAIGALAWRMIQSPSFLYRSELGEKLPSGDYRLTPFEVASALAYFLVDGPPDGTLLDAAAAGQLGQPEDLRAHAQRLIMTAERSVGLLKFFHEYLGTEEVFTANTALLQNPTLMKALAEEPDRFVRHVLWSGDRKWQTLLSPGFTIADQTLAKHYGSAEKLTGWRALSLSDRPGGLLTQGALLAVHQGPTTRGTFVREMFFCLSPLMAAPGVPSLDEATEEAEKATGRVLTARAVVERHSKDPTCAGCHALIDPFGHPLSSYDKLGRLVTKVGDEVVDTRGGITGTAHSDGAVANATELARRIAGSADAQQCFVQQVWHYATGRPPGPREACAIRDLSTRFASTGGDVVDLVVNLVSSDAFLTRAPMEETK